MDLIEAKLHEIRENRIGKHGNELLKDLETQHLVKNQKFDIVKLRQP